MERRLCDKVMRNGIRCIYHTNNNDQYCGRHGGLTVAGYRELCRTTRLVGKITSDVDDITDSVESLKLAKTEKDQHIPLDDCMICIDTVNELHYNLYCCDTNFCKSCLDDWYKISKKCPHCRTPRYKIRSPRYKKRRPSLEIDYDDDPFIIQH